MARYEDAASSAGLTVATLVTASYRIPGSGPPTAGLAPLVRLSLVGDSPPAGAGGIVFGNPLVGVAYAVTLGGGLRSSFFLGATLPLGTGGGDSPSEHAMSARLHGANARAQLDGSLFAVNDVALIPGLAVAWVRAGWTVQIEMTIFHMMRVRGAAAQSEASKTNATMGMHVGVFVIPELSLGAELRYQRWLNAPFAVDADPTGATRDNLTVALGPRVHLELGSLGWLRPGVSYQRALDRPLAAASPNVHLVQIDVPFVFR
ncbi:MAG: hypothetical protein KF819_09240 [Labilithrix sp.]|nr:hypothetical protein [Labilithrix sp.]